jgi:hypothetical protein
MILRYARLLLLAVSRLPKRLALVAMAADAGIPENLVTRLMALSYFRKLFNYAQLRSDDSFVHA